ncbi:hypothetical protein BDV93DRAFT_608656 [Ceratobasidium sp. AG-I]|nr:hypothetical protein BDV93DRAFT_608656 [Ceratobasidium sp. AG-I]
MLLMKSMRVGGQDALSRIRRTLPAELEADLKHKSEARTTQGAVLSITVLRLLPRRSTLSRWDVCVTVGFERYARLSLHSSARLYSWDVNLRIVRIYIKFFHRSTISRDITKNPLNPDNWE